MGLDVSQNIGEEMNEKVSQNALGFPASIYFDKIYSEAVKMAELKPSDYCLDFGCGNQRLKPFVNCKYVGFDVLEKFSNLSDYRKEKPSVVFALNVLEHLNEHELSDFQQWAYEIKPKLVVSIPTNSFLSKFFVWLLGYGLVHEVEHLNYWQPIVKELKKDFMLVGCKRVYLM